MEDSFKEVLLEAAFNPFKLGKGKSKKGKEISSKDLA